MVVRFDNKQVRYLESILLGGTKKMSGCSFYNEAIMGLETLKDRATLKWWYKLAFMIDLSKGSSLIKNGRLNLGKEGNLGVSIYW